MRSAQETAACLKSSSGYLGRLAGHRAGGRPPSPGRTGRSRRVPRWAPRSSLTISALFQGVRGWPVPRPGRALRRRTTLGRRRGRAAWSGFRVSRPGSAGGGSGGLAQHDVGRGGLVGVGRRAPGAVGSGSASRASGATRGRCGRRSGRRSASSPRAWRADSRAPATGGRTTWPE